MSQKIFRRGAVALAGAVAELYAAGQTDYFLDPIVLTEPRGTGDRTDRGFYRGGIQPFSAPGYVRPDLCHPDPLP